MHIYEKNVGKIHTKIVSPLCFLLCVCSNDLPIFFFYNWAFIIFLIKKKHKPLLC